MQWSLSYVTDNTVEKIGAMAGKCEQWAQRMWLSGSVIWNWFIVHTSAPNHNFFIHVLLHLNPRNVSSQSFISLYAMPFYYNVPVCVYKVKGFHYCPTRHSFPSLWLLTSQWTNLEVLDMESAQSMTYCLPPRLCQNQILLLVIEPHDTSVQELHVVDTITDQTRYRNPLSHAYIRYFLYTKIHNIHFKEIGKSLGRERHQ